jgi:hypothetical protein
MPQCGIGIIALYQSDKFICSWGKRMKLKSLTLSLVLILLGLFLFRPVAAEDVPRITKEELKGLLGHPDVVVIDVRHSQNWQDSDLKIKSATRGNPDQFSSWFDQFPKDKTLILY